MSTVPLDPKFPSFDQAHRRSWSLVITQCCIHELYLQGKTEQPAVDLAKTFERRKCNHREAIPGNDCIEQVVGELLTSVSQRILMTEMYANPGESNKHRYVIATQSPALRSALRSIPAVPVVHINRSVMILEPPSDTTLNAKDSVRSLFHANRSCSGYSRNDIHRLNSSPSSHLLQRKLSFQ